MILVADSGSTKTDWCLVNDGLQVKSVFTAGINPFFQTQEEISSLVLDMLLPQLENYTVDSVFFYGAGCVPDKCSMVEAAIAVALPDARIVVESDLLGAARGLLGSSGGIACILGTGSNSCLYDGSAIIQQVSPLGFILGDEGSGAVLGKKFVADCLKNQIPKKLQEKFLTTYSLTAADIINSVYRQPFPNRFLAQFTKFMYDHIGEPSVYNLVFDSFSEFFTRNVQQYVGYDTMEVSFVGSIAYYFKDVLEVVAQELGMTVGHIVQTPMEGLIKYHSAN